MLTRREREIISLIERDYGNREIAATLMIELGSVKVHVANILRKLNVNRRRNAVKVWRTIEPPPVVVKATVTETIIRPEFSVVWTEYEP